MQGVKRVIIFCLLTTILPAFLLILPLHLRHNIYTDVVYAVTESDVLEINDGISTIFCSSHTLHTNATINAFQMSHRPEITSNRVHLRLKKSMTLPDDTLEYWGFYLLRGATVALSVCSRFPGASILVVKGERTLRTCGMLDHNKNKQHSQGIFSPQARDNVKITFESHAREINSNEVTTPTSTSNDLKEADDINSVSTIAPQKDPTHEDETLKPSTKSVHSYPRHMAEVDAEKKITTHLKPTHVSPTENTIQKRNFTNEELESLISKSTKKGKKNEIELLKKKLNTQLDDVGAEEADFPNKPGELFQHPRIKRNQEPVRPPALLNRGVKHGGNALKNQTDDIDSSVSSFEEGLLNCYDGNVLISQEFEPSPFCINVSFFENSKYMQSRHNVAENGYYYYIFYSDNDYVSNDIHAVFDIYKPSFQYEDVTQSCINKSECTFPLSIMSSDRVIVEVPTRDGIDHEEDDISVLISVCHPRVGIYILFPVAVLFLILSCAFL